MTCNSDSHPDRSTYTHQRARATRRLFTETANVSASQTSSPFPQVATVDTFFHNQDFYSRHLPAKVLFADKDGRLYQRRISQYQVRPVAGDSGFPALTERVEAEEELARYRQELRALTTELALAEERERRRIADGLHEQLGQLLATAKLRLGTLAEPGDSEARVRAFEEIRELLDQALGKTRSLTFELSCPILYRLGLEPALQDLGERLGRQNGLRVDFSSDRRPKPLGEGVQVILFQVVRELLFNVVKHAQATAVRLRLSRTGGEIRIAVEDDGVGFDPAQLRRGPTAAGGIGLFSIRERLDHLGGRLEIGSAANGGTRMVVAAPLDPVSETSE